MTELKVVTLTLKGEALPTEQQIADHTVLHHAVDQAGVSDVLSVDNPDSVTFPSDSE